jgi:uncharacterized coiled-coil DUF342 family protein
MRGILEYSVELNQSIGAYKTQVAYLTDQLDQAQSQVKLLPAQTDTLRSQIGNKDQEILELKTKIRSFELEARHDQNKIIDAEKKLKEIESNLLNQIGETAKAQAIADELKSQVESLQAENLELKSRIDAEAKKTWIDKLINKEAKK